MKTVLRKRVQVSFKNTISRTKPEFSKSVDINQIVKRGLPPAPPLQYADLTNLPSLEDAFRITRHAEEMFSKLPSNIRKLIDNDPSRLEEFIKDPENQELLIREKILIPPKQEIPPAKPDAERVPASTAAKAPSAKTSKTDEKTSE